MAAAGLSWVPVLISNRVGLKDIVERYKASAIFDVNSFRDLAERAYIAQSENRDRFARF